MRKIYKIGLSDEWVLKHRNDETLPIEVLKQVFSSMKGFVVCESTYNSLTVSAPRRQVRRGRVGGFGELERGARFR